MCFAASANSVVTSDAGLFIKMISMLWVLVFKSLNETAAHACFSSLTKRSAIRSTRVKCFCMELQRSASHSRLTDCSWVLAKWLISAKTYRSSAKLVVLMIEGADGSAIERTGG